MIQASPADVAKGKTCVNADALNLYAARRQSNVIVISPEKAAEAFKQIAALGRK